MSSLALAPAGLAGCTGKSAEWTAPAAGYGGTATHAGSAGAGGFVGSVGSAGSSGAAGVAGSMLGGTATISAPELEPASLRVEPKPGGEGALHLIALTLKEGAGALGVFAALRNDGDTVACSPAFSVELLDREEQSLGTSVSGLLVHDVYRLTSDASLLAGCVPPGAVAMAALTDWDAELVLADVGRAVYWLNYWVLDVTPLGRLDVVDVARDERDAGVAYSGVLVNALDVPLESPSVAIFPLAARGRPIGMALARGSEPLAPGERWSFQTATVDEAGVGYAAYPANGP